MADEYESPILIHRTGTLIEIEHAANGDILATCQIGDDESMEHIADMLSSKRLRREAAMLRKLMMEARKPVGRGIW